MQALPDQPTTRCGRSGSRRSPGRPAFFRGRTFRGQHWAFAGMTCFL